MVGMVRRAFVRYLWLPEKGVNGRSACFPVRSKGTFEMERHRIRGCERQVS